MAKTKTPPEIYQIKVTLRDSKPPIWRRLLVSSDITLAQLHTIIQIAMGWTNSHLHQFVIGAEGYSFPNKDLFFDNDFKDESRAKLNKLVDREGVKFKYEYDFGDGWEHTILIEKILPYDPTQKLPTCIKGKRACPPEDIGGVWGYDSFLEAMQDPEYPEHDEYSEWIGGEFDPEEFDLNAVNQILHRNSSDI